MNTSLVKPIKVGSCVIIERPSDNHVLLIHRGFTGTGLDGLFVFPGGHVDGNETARSAAARELFEEVGLISQPEDLRFVHCGHRKFPQSEVIIFIFATRQWQGEPINKEPHKHQSVGWFSKHNLPREICPLVSMALSPQEVPVYSELGW